MQWSFKDLVRDALTRVTEVSCEEASKHVAHSVVIDVREHDETSGVLLPDAVQLPRGLVEKHIQEHVADRATPVVVYSARLPRLARAKGLR